MKEIKGYKPFDKDCNDLTNNVLLSSIESTKKMGNTKYSFAENLEDSLKFNVYSQHKRPIITEVTGIGNIRNIESDYYEFYNTFVADDLRIDKILTPEEVIEYARNLNQSRLERFVSLYKLNNDEIKALKEKYLKVDLALLYYQKNQLNIYKLYYESWYSEKKSEQLKQLIKKL